MSNNNQSMVKIVNLVWRLEVRMRHLSQLLRSHEAASKVSMIFLLYTYIIILDEHTNAVAEQTKYYNCMTVWPLVPHQKPSIIKSHKIKNNRSV